MDSSQWYLVWFGSKSKILVRKSSPFKNPGSVPAHLQYLFFTIIYNKMQLFIILPSHTFHFLYIYMYVHFLYIYMYVYFLYIYMYTAFVCTCSILVFHSSIQVVCYYMYIVQKGTTIWFIWGGQDQLLCTWFFSVLLVTEPFIFLFFTKLFILDFISHLILTSRRPLIKIKYYMSGYRLPPLYTGFLSRGSFSETMDDIRVKLNVKCHELRPLIRFGYYLRFNENNFNSKWPCVFNRNENNIMEFSRPVKGRKQKSASRSRKEQRRCVN